MTFNAVVNTGSPISLLKSEFLQNNCSVITPALSNNFLGIYGVKLEIFLKPMY